MRESGSCNDTWEEDGPPRAGSPAASDAGTLDAAKKWLERAVFRRLALHMQAADPSRVERDRAFTAMAEELQQSLKHLRAALEVGERLKAENFVLRRAVAKKASAPADRPA